MKKRILLLFVLLLLTGCGTSEPPPEATEAAQAVQPANPWVSHNTLAEAERAAGFPLSMPEEIGNFRAASFRVMNGRLLEVIYRNGDSEVILRKQAGEGQDLSGVYEAFEKETVYQTGSSWIISRIWDTTILDLVDSDGYSWSLYAPGGYPGDSHGCFLNALTDQTPEWLREANEAFNATVREYGGGTRAGELSCFFSCTWERPEKIDLAEFLRYCPLGEQLFDEHTEEAQAVIAAMGENPFLVTPVWRYPREAVSALLQTYTGITVEELLSWEGVLYLEEYDAFYNCTSDWGPGRFQCTGGDCSGNPIVLWGEGNGGAARTLTVRKEGEAYFLVSYLDREE